MSDTDEKIVVTINLSPETIRLIQKTRVFKTRLLLGSSFESALEGWLDTIASTVEFEHKTQSVKERRQGMHLVKGENND